MTVTEYNNVVYKVLINNDPDCVDMSKVTASHGNNFGPLEVIKMINRSYARRLYPTQQGAKSVKAQIEKRWGVQCKIMASKFDWVEVDG